MNIPILYEDDWLLVVDKPAGLLTIPTPKNERRTLSSILNDYAKEKGFSYRFHPCHRLDRQTSGLIIYAKGKSIQKKVMDLFKDRKIKKKYTAFVHGRILKNRDLINMPIEGRDAITEYKLIEQKKDFAILEVTPLTGRTNQIRIHLKGIGHPIVGDTKYAFRKDFRLKSKRLCLHAAELEFQHPVTAKFVHIYSELPKDLKEFL